MPRNARVEEMESVIRTICEPIFDKPLSEISFGTVLLRLFEALRRFDGQIQPQLILLQKTLLNIEGLGRQLYPDLNIWQTATPVLRKWMRQRVSPLRLLRDMRAQLPDALDALRAAAVAGQALHRAHRERRTAPCRWMPPRWTRCARNCAPPAGAVTG